VAIRFMRINRITSCCCPALNPGAMPNSALTRGTAKTATRMARVRVTSKARLAIRLKSSQAGRCPERVSTSESTGIKAIASAPPEISANSRSGTLLATLKASNSTERPNWRAIRIWRINASILSNKKKNASKKVIFVRRESFIK